MFFNFFFTYKKNLISASNKYGLYCNWAKNRNFLLKHYLVFSRYFKYLLKGEGVPQKLFEKVYKIQDKNLLNNKSSFCYWVDDSMPKNKLEEMLCGWVATATMLKVDIHDHVNDMIEEADIPFLSKRYLRNKLKTI